MSPASIPTLISYLWCRTQYCSKDSGALCNLPTILSPQLLRLAALLPRAPSHAAALQCPRHSGPSHQKTREPSMLPAAMQQVDRQRLGIGNVVSTCVLRRVPLPLLHLSDSTATTTSATISPPPTPSPSLPASAGNTSVLLVLLVFYLYC